MVCLDTSVLVALIRRDQVAIEGLAAEAERGGKVSTTVLNLCELYSGAFGSRNPPKELARVEDLISDLGILDLDAGAAKRYGELVNDATLKRATIGDFDLLIASIALEQKERLVTRNIKHFSRVPSLVTEEW